MRVGKAGRAGDKGAYPTVWGLIMLRTLVLVLGLALPVWASEEAPGGTGNIGESEWRSLAAGKTLTYTIDGEFFALERYPLSGNRVSIQMWDGRCLSGHWTYENSSYCFYWENMDPVCFLHRRVGPVIEVSQVVGGIETGEIQTMTSVSDAPLNCGALTS